MKVNAYFAAIDKVALDLVDNYISDDYDDFVNSVFCEQSLKWLLYEFIEDVDKLHYCSSLWSRLFDDDSCRYDSDDRLHITLYLDNLFDCLFIDESFEWFLERDVLSHFDFDEFIKDCFDEDSLEDEDEDLYDDLYDEVVSHISLCIIFHLVRNFSQKIISDEKSIYLFLSESFEFDFTFSIFDDSYFINYYSGEKFETHDALISYLESVYI